MGWGFLDDSIIYKAFLKPYGRGVTGMKCIFSNWNMVGNASEGVVSPRERLEGKGSRWNSE